MIVSFRDAKAMVRNATGQVFVQFRVDGPVPGTVKRYPGVFLCRVGVSKVQAQRLLESMQKVAPDGAGVELRLIVQAHDEDIVLFAKGVDASADPCG